MTTECEVSNSLFVFVIIIINMGGPFALWRHFTSTIRDQQGVLLKALLEYERNQMGCNTCSKMKIYNMSDRVVFASARFYFPFSRPCLFSCWTGIYTCVLLINSGAIRGLVLNSYPALCSRFKFVPSLAVFVSISYPFHMLSCSVLIPLVFYLCGVWRLRVKFVSSRAVFVFISYFFHAVSCSVRCALVSFLWVLESSCQIRIQSCGVRVYSVYFSSGFVFSS